MFFFVVLRILFKEIFLIFVIFWVVNIVILGLLNLLRLLVICDGIKYGELVFNSSLFNGILKVSLWIFVVFVKVIIVVIFIKRFENFW